MTAHAAVAIVPVASLVPAGQSCSGTPSLLSFLSWTLDGFDFTIVSFLLADLQTSFGVSKAAVGAIGTVTL